MLVKKQIFVKNLQEDRKKNTIMQAGRIERIAKPEMHTISILLKNWIRYTVANRRQKTE